ncbi:hypothetical protein [Haloferax volcanii]|uniref:hypothetical protein n=1 Tax=Haloferax volcanii TaxID=2246 RepID=UPI00249B976C|nr:hypothetical protein [Haloferax alexandrinus]WEL29822.1 hypothetical protein HBNXHx_1716 [Haloferax alexandrinus]
MAEYIHPDVEEASSDLHGSETIALAFVCDEGYGEEVAHQLKRHGANVTAELPDDVLVAEVQVSDISTVCELENVLSITLDGDARILA